MASVLDSTVGGAASNSYCTEVEATAYHAKRFLNDAWTEATVEDREKVLMWATRLMDQLEWLGRRNTDTQALRWPRSGCVDREGFSVSYTTIPTAIKEACSEWALYLLTEDRTLDEGGLVEVGGAVGPIVNPKAYSRKVIPDGVRDMLASYISSIEGYGRVLRV